MPDRYDDHSSRALTDRQRTDHFRLLAEEAAFYLDLGLTGAIPLGQAVWEANVTFRQAVAMLVAGPVDGWPCGEAA